MLVSRQQDQDLSTLVPMPMQPKSNVVLYLMVLALRFDVALFTCTYIYAVPTEVQNKSVFPLPIWEFRLGVYM